jgi:hypothetical protein
VGGIRQFIYLYCLFSFHFYFTTFIQLPIFSFYIIKHFFKVRKEWRNSPKPFLFFLNNLLIVAEENKKLGALLFYEISLET